MIAAYSTAPHARLIYSTESEPVHDARILLVVIGEATRRLHRLGLDPLALDDWGISGLCSTLAAEIGEALHDLPMRTVGAGVLEAVRDHVRTLRLAREAGRAGR